MKVLVTVASVVLLIELALTAVSAGAGLQIWLERMHDLTRVAFSRPAQLGVFAITSVAGVLVLYGFFAPWARAAGGALAAAGAAFVVVQQLRHADPFTSLLPYLLFLTCGIVLVVGFAT
ncbi:hypothetical protein [Salinispora arenicola]|uniref:hypothetical protein n=1 Tax=Salinispora arenicola TaxID=168697 RepID=UPI00037EAFE1|nr:hypothetical protein [Salinispora arenicola]